MNWEMLTIGRILLCAVDVVMLYLFFKAMFQLRGYGTGVCASLFIIEIGAILLINSYGNTWLNLMVIPFSYMAFALLMFKLSVIGALTFTVIYYAIFAGGREVAYEMLFRMISSYPQFQIPAWFTSAGFWYLIPEYIFGFLFLLLIVKSLKKLDIGGHQGVAWYLLFMPVTSLIVLSAYMYMDFPDSVLIQRLICIGAFLLYFSNAAVFLVLAKYKGIMNLAKYEEMAGLRQTLEEDEFQNITRLNRLYRDYMHDMNSYLIQIRSLAAKKQSEKIIELVDDLRGEARMEDSNIVYNTNEILNIILAERSIRAKNKGIEMSVFVEPFINVDFISSADMVSMFGNLLDNALEASDTCEAGNRKVDVRLFMGNRYMLVLYIKNSFTVSARREGEKLLTTKKEKQFHGLGIGIVNRLAEKYGGTLLLEENGDNFITTINLSESKKL